MSNAKHTPGPWVAIQEYSNRWRIDAPREGFVPVTVTHVSTTILEMGTSCEDTGANAHLISAAPDMLEALEAAENPCGDYYTGLHCGIEDRDITDRYDAASYGWDRAFEYIESVIDAAIAKAKGEA